MVIEYYLDSACTSFAGSNTFSEANSMALGCNPSDNAYSMYACTTAAHPQVSAESAMVQ
jgi:hypothetical protein